MKKVLVFIVILNILLTGAVVTVASSTYNAPTDLPHEV